MDGDLDVTRVIVPISGRRLTLPQEPIFHLKRADQCDYELGEFRAWAGYKNFGADDATGDLVHFQHVLSFARSDQTGRTGIHAHLAHVHVVIPTSGSGVFSYDGLPTDALPGVVIVQHGGTVHDQFQYSHGGGSPAENSATPLALEPEPEGTPVRSFGFLELFVPKIFANVDIVPPQAVTPEDEASAWDHPYHAAHERYHLQGPDSPTAAYRPVAGRDDIEARDCETWDATGGLVATWFIRPAVAATGPAVTLDIPGETGGVVILHLASGAASVLGPDGETVRLCAGDTLTHSQGLAGPPFDCSPDMRAVLFFVSAKIESLRERTPDEIRLIEDLGPRVITRREVRPAGDSRPVNFLHRG